MQYLPIIYVRGYAGSDKDVEEAVNDPFYGFNSGSTHIRRSPSDVRTASRSKPRRAGDALPDSHRGRVVATNSR